MRWVTAFWALSLVVFVTVAWTVNNRVGALRSSVEILRSEEEPMTATWKHRRSNGFIITITVNVPRQEGEGVDEWGARAQAEIAEMESQFPPNVEQ